MMAHVDASDLRVIPKTIRELNQFAEQQVFAKLVQDFRPASLQVQVAGYIGQYASKLWSDQYLGVPLYERPDGGEILPVNLGKSLLDDDQSIGPTAYVTVIGILTWYREKRSGHLILQINVAKKRNSLTFARDAAKLWQHTAMEFQLIFAV